MKNILKIKNLFFVLLLSLLTISCVDDDYDFGEITSPSNINLTTQVMGQSEEMPYGDGSGAVNFTVSADNAMTYKFIYGDGFEEVSHDGTTTHSFNKNGINDYIVTVVAYGKGGSSANTTTEITVFSDFSDPEAAQLLTGGSSKTWYIAAAQPAHLGVGPSSGEGFDSPIWYAAAPFEKAADENSACFYTDEMTFSLAGDGQIKYDYENNGLTFFNADFTTDFGGGGGEDQCLPYESSGTMNVSLSPATSGIPAEASRGTVINISDGGFISYYIGTSSYEIMSISENTMYLRTVMGNNPDLAWYLILTSSPDESEPEPEEFETRYNNLVWEENFDSGSLNTEIWNFETGNNNGWGNQESQYYTEDNATVEEGNLIITAKAESSNGFDYTSSRITTKDNFAFTYGRVEVRAKLPSGGGVWPAIWMLGANFNEVGWPASGEIDIMEYVGNNPGVVHGTLHYPGNSGGNANSGTTAVDNPETEFHLYSVEWTPENIYFLVDNKVFHKVENTADLPFHHDFFLILNVAMGGTFGGEIDPNFTKSSMVVDYVKVFQAEE